MSRGPLVIVGASYAGLNIAIAERELGSDRRIMLLGDELEVPYQRPPLSKTFLANKIGENALPLRPAALFSTLNIELLTGIRVVSIDRQSKAVLTAAGDRIQYDKLALTTGCRARSLSLPGAGSENVAMLRTLADARRLRELTATCREIVIIGGGFIGLEVAGTLALAGAAVTVVELEGRLLQRAVSPQVSAALTRLHLKNNVDLRTNVKAVGIDTAGGRARAVRLSDGSIVPCDLVIVGIGSIANDELAAAAGLRCNDGVLVDECGRTSDPAIVAAGDCTRHPNPFGDGRLIRLESVQNATDQARAVAASLEGAYEPYSKVPWFWSDQYDMKVQIAGLIQNASDSVMRGDAESGRFSIFHFDTGRLVGAESLGKPADHLFARRCLSENLSVTPELVADRSVELLKMWNPAKGVLRPADGGGSQAML